MEKVEYEFVQIDFCIRSRGKFIQKTRKKVISADVLRGEGNIKNIQSNRK